MLADDRHRLIFYLVASISPTPVLRNLALVSRNIYSAIHAQLFRSMDIRMSDPKWVPFLAALLNTTDRWRHARFVRFASISTYTNVHTKHPTENIRKVSAIIHALPNLCQVQVTAYRAPRHWTQELVDFTLMFEALARLESLRRLILHGTEFGNMLPVAPELLQKIGPKLESIILLDASARYLETKLSLPFPDLLAFPVLQFLTLESPLSDLARLLTSLPHPERLRTLHVITFDLTSAEAFGDALVYCTKLEELSLSSRSWDGYDQAGVPIREEDDIEDPNQAHTFLQAVPDLIPSHPTLRYLSIEALPFPFATLEITPRQFSYTSDIEDRDIDFEEEKEEDDAVYMEKVLVAYERRNLRWARNIHSAFKQGILSYAKHAPSLERVHWAPWDLSTEDGFLYHADAWITRSEGKVSGVQGGFGRKLEGLAYLDKKSHEAFGEFKGPYDVDL